MSLNSYDPNGGDMGRAAGPTTFGEFRDEVFRGIETLEKARRDENHKHKYLRYAIETNDPSVYVEWVENLGHAFFPKGLKWFKIDGRILFAIRGCSGGATTRRICYIVSEPEK